MPMKRLSANFYQQDAQMVAPLLLGKQLVRVLDSGETMKLTITETECYCGEIDSACHARAGRTSRTKILYEPGGVCYVYMIYGIHFLLNVVTGLADCPQAVLIRAAKGYNGPGKLTKHLRIDKQLNGADLISSGRIWIEDNGLAFPYKTAPRVGIDYASEPYKSIEWRFILME